MFNEFNFSWPMTTTLKKPVILGLIQMCMSTDAEQNLSEAAHYIREAAKRGADIICLPELFRSPYFCQEPDSATDYREECPGPVGQTLSHLAAELQVTIVGGSIYEKTAKLGFNTTLVYGPQGQLLGQYRKTHIPHDPGFYEQHYFDAAEPNYQVFTTVAKGQSVRFSTLICYDQWFPEAARAVALQGAEIIFYPTAIGTPLNRAQHDGDWQEAWTTVQRGHAIANASVVVAVNRVGVEGATHFWGGSFVANAFGHVLTKGTDQAGVLIAEVDLAHNQQIKTGWRFFAERRPDSYTNLIAKVNV